MSWPDDFHARLDEWGEAVFAQEIETGFSRARVFDGSFARIEFDALKEFSKEDLKVLGTVLPVLDDAYRKTLAGKELQLVNALHEVRKRLLTERHQEIIEESLRLHRAVREEMMKIKKAAQAIFKELAKRWNCELRKDEGFVWIFSRPERWGELSMPFDLHEKIEFSYYISIQDNDYRRVLEQDHYLGRLGLISKSACRIDSVQTCEEKLWKASEIIEWQLNEYLRMMESSNWPRIAAFK
jgi:hypothetical protein